MPPPIETVGTRKIAATGGELSSASVFAPCPHHARAATWAFIVTGQQGDSRPHTPMNHVKSLSAEEDQGVHPHLTTSRPPGTQP